MALVLVPIGLAVLGGGYAYGCYHLAQAIDSRTRTLLGHPKSPSHFHTCVFLPVLGLTYAAGARALRPAFGRLRQPENVQSAAEFLQAVAPGIARHVLGCTGGVAAAAAASAAYDVRQAKNSSSDSSSLRR